MRAFPFVLSLVILVAGCSSPDEPTTTITTTTPTTAPTPPAELPFARGVALSPKSFQGNDFAEFFGEARSVGSLVMWGGPVEQLADDEAAPSVVAQLAHRNGLGVVVQASPFRERGEEPALDENLTAAVARFVSRAQPEYLALGVEVNRFAEKNATRFDEYVVWYDATYDAVKAASPLTNVLVTFQYEQMEGYRGGLFGGADAAPQQWDLLDKFPKRDLVGFTVYPGLVLTDPSDAGAQYYANLTRGGKFAVTETAHFADTPAIGWESSPAEQARFARSILAVLNETIPEFALWLHLHDQSDAPPPFGHMGLIDEAGAKRPAWNDWAPSP